LFQLNSQIEIEGDGDDLFSQDGDSGSLIVNSHRLAVALLFAGSDLGGSNGKGLTYAKHLQACPNMVAGQEPVFDPLSEGAVEHARQRVLYGNARRGPEPRAPPRVQHGPGVQFTAAAFIRRLESVGAAVSKVRWGLGGARAYFLPWAPDNINLSHLSPHPGPGAS